MNETITIPQVDEIDINRTLAAAQNAADEQVNEILDKACALKGLDLADVAVLCWISTPSLLERLFDTARFVKNSIYGRRLVLFAPLYISNLCGNECLYCAFRARNTSLKRRALTQEEIVRETTMLVRQGHKRVLLVAGESYPQEGFSYILRSIDSVYSVKAGAGEIRRVNVNIAPLSIDEFAELKKRRIGTYQLFQETYHRETYHRMHQAGKKRDYDWRISALDRALQAGIDDVGIGVLFGLYDWRFEVLAMLHHIRHLENSYGIGPHTISVPRLEPAAGSTISTHPPYPVDDDDFKKIVAILRCAVPYTGIIMSTRETARMRQTTFALGVSQISAGSRTNPGGYCADDFDQYSSQFSLGDHRSLDEVVRDAAAMGYIPSFCTACYRLGRTGKSFMDLSKPGDIKKYCDPNALSTFMEYLLNYASEETKRIGENLIRNVLASMESCVRIRAEKLLSQVKAKRHDVFC